LLFGFAGCVRVRLCAWRAAHDAASRLSVGVQLCLRRRAFAWLASIGALRALIAHVRRARAMCAFP
jgi:hypothetical protein